MRQLLDSSWLGLFRPRLEAGFCYLRGESLVSPRGGVWQDRHRSEGFISLWGRALLIIEVLRPSRLSLIVASLTCFGELPLIRAVDLNVEPERA